MTTSALKNIVRREIHDANGNVMSWEVLDFTGAPIAACALFIRKMEGYAFATKKRYVEAVCRFVDYLYESRVLGCFHDDDQLPTRQYINAVIDGYIPLLLRGSNATVEILSTDEGATDEHQWMIQVASALNIKPCQRKSLDNVIAAINRFLRLSEALAQEAQDLAGYHGFNLPIEYTPLINVVDGFAKLTTFERQAIRSASMLGGVIRMHGEIRRPAGIRSEAKKQQADQTNMDFPVSHMSALIVAATNWRDRALWLLLLASGIRRSEALNLQWSDIDYKKRRVYVLDPGIRRYGRFMTPEEKLRFKGRTVSWTYLWEPWRSQFFEALAEYRKREWHLPTDGNDYVFQIRKLHNGALGVPLLHASDAALNQSFKEAVIRASIPGPGFNGDGHWTPHSLRHAYGVYMLNYIPIAPGVHGFPETDVQALMGHESIMSTRRYARRKEDVLLAKLQYADQVALGLAVADQGLLGLPVAQQMLPPILLEHLVLQVDALHD